MKCKVVFVNRGSRLAAAHIGQQKYIVFEYQSGDQFEEGEELKNLRKGFGRMRCSYQEFGRKATINVLSSAMSYAKAKLVVAPWQGVSLDEANIA